MPGSKQGKNGYEKSYKIWSIHDAQFIIWGEGFKQRKSHTRHVKTPSLGKRHRSEAHLPQVLDR